MTSQIRYKQKAFAESRSDKESKVLGQYFTDGPIADFMSSLIDVESLDPKDVKLLDCGAGYGMLTATTALHLLENGIERLEATLYEIDEKVIDSLTEVLEEVKSAFSRKGRVFNYEVINDDFVVERPDLKSVKRFDVAVINPPYFKYSAKTSVYAKKTADLFKGDPNIYASFIAITLATMADNGQVVVISPRSFLNGLYFKGFRKYLLSHSRLDHIHIFKSRNKVFLDSDILQENIIFKLVKSKDSFSEVIISSSNTIAELQYAKVNSYPKNIIIDNSNNEGFIRIPESEKDFEILQKAENFPSNFSKEGYFVSTGPVVEHRTKEFLNKVHFQKDQVPLIRAHNVLTDGIYWDGRHKKDLSFDLKETFEKHLVSNKRFLILKRFTSKDEHRRLVGGVYEPIENLDFIAITNKLNYIGRKGSDLPKIEALGLCVLFNSAFYDHYYRCISGNTQVNATDVRLMKTPTREQIIQLGEKAATYGVLSYENIEHIIEDVLNV
ncbi:Eco57I restriction-modification methylase domain-containing protein [Phaeodactylibacter xiamenensis]|uniref:Eco57I restriction-modification methylase domain-containing protein n=1 Tax=Phaeodactylibacter xiamenensis TaxID=1524460 RepID=UPI003BA938E9